MTDPLPHPRLAALLKQIEAEVPERFATLLDAPGFSESRAALRVLGQPGRREAVVADLSAAEAEWIADEIERLRARLPLSGPLARATLSAPSDAWTAGGPVEIVLDLTVEGLAPGWTATWPEGASAEPEGTRARLALTPAAAPLASHVVRVVGHSADGARALLLAEAQTRLRTPIARREAGRLLLADADGYPARGLTVDIDGTAVTLDAAGTTPIDGAAPDLRLAGHAIPLEG